MKRSIFFLVLILSFSACSEFHHMHYRKVKKVPAKGFVETLPVVEKKIVQQEKVSPAVDSSKSVEPEIINEKPGSAAPVKNNDRAYNISPTLKKQIEKLPLIKNFSRDKLQVKKPISYKRDNGKTTFIIILLLVLGLGLIIFGASMFIVGFYAMLWYMILLGLVIFFLGVLPFLGLVSYLAGDKFKSESAPYQER